MESDHDEKSEARRIADLSMQILDLLSEHGDRGHSSFEITQALCVAMARLVVNASKQGDRVTRGGKAPCMR